MAIDGDPIQAAEALIAAGKAHQAARTLRARLAEGRGGVLARVTLVAALLADGDVRGALAEAREAVSLNPEVPEALVALGEALLAAENLPAAIAEFQRALRHDPAHAKARHLVGKAWLAAGEGARALDSFAELSEGLPGLEEDRARARAILTASRSDPGYVRHLFDQFAADYDSRMLGELGYGAPSLLAELAELVMGAQIGLSVLDLGCGTGLAGLIFRSRATRLTGIDLSPAMIAKAAERGLYDRLEVADLESWLRADGERYDLVLAADTLVYLGDLAPVFAGVRARLAPGGFFLFTLESKNGEGFALGPKRRWQHSEAYVRGQAAAEGLTVAGLVRASPRSEAGVPVPGLAVALTQA